MSALNAPLKILLPFSFLRLPGISLVFLLLFGNCLQAQNVLESGIDKLTLTGCTNVGGQIKITGTGNIHSNKAYFNSETTLDEIDLNFDVVVDSLNTGGEFQFGAGKLAGTAGTQVEFHGNATTSSVRISRLNGTSATLVLSYPLPFSIALHNSYSVRIGKRTRNLLIEITSADGTQHFYNDTLSYPTPFFGCMWGTPFIGCKNGQISLTSFSLTTPMSLHPRLSAWGDSFIEGNSVPFSNLRYISLIRDSIGYNNVTISGRGGETSGTLNSRFKTEVGWLDSSKYALLAIGVNDSNFPVWLNNVQKDLDTLTSHHLVPVIVTLTPRSDRLAFIAQANSWIRDTYDGAYVDLAKSVSSNGINWIPGMAISDSIHPSVAGNIKIYERFQLEAPYLFRDYDAFTIDYMNETTAENVPDTIEYSIESHFVTATNGSLVQAPLIPGTTLYFRDTAFHPYHSLFYLLPVPERPHSPIDPVVNTATGTFDWTNNPAFTALTDYEYSLDSVTWMDCNQKPLISPGTLCIQLRVKATATNFRSETLYLLPDTTSGLNEFAENEIRILSNFVTDQVVIQNITEPITLSIYSGAGTLVKEMELYNNISIVGMEEMSNGLYYFVLQNTKQARNFKILKQ